LIKTDSQGNTNWTREFGNTSVWNYGYCVQQTLDGGYIIAGENYPSDRYMLLWKTDASGHTVWSNSYGANIATYSYGAEVQQTSDKGYIVTGPVIPGLSSEIYLVKVSSNGNTNWTRVYGSTNYESACSVKQTHDHGYIIAGLTESYGAGSEDVYLIRADSNGNRIWTNTFGGANDDRAWSVDQCSDRNFIVTGETFSSGAGGYDVYLLKVSTNGSLLWSKTIGGTADDEGFSVQQTSDGGFIIAGITSSFGAGDRDVYLVKTDSSGNTVWSRTFGGPSYENYDGSFIIRCSVQQTSDGGYAVIGSTHSFGAGGSEVYLIKVDADGN
ncbi:MAG: hypothetical protein PHF84_11740, partial [bacterium]|nr:hypothetical protein [bacterium]